MATLPHMTLTNADIQSSLARIRATLPPTCQLVAVSKYHPASSIMAAYEAGQRIFGESHEQELRVKQAELPPDIEWHFIGHLQTNKVRFIVPYIAMIHAVDSLRLLREIDKQAQRVDRVVKVLLEVHLAQESTKYGLTPDALQQLLQGPEWRLMSHVQVCGLMTMASDVDDEAQIAAEFAAADELFNHIKATYFAHDPAFCQRSWGMSGDYHIALQHHSTMVRVGTAIFGPRQY